MNGNVGPSRHCLDCDSTQSSKWIKDRVNQLAYRCNACYQKTKASAKTAEGVSCLDCSRRESASWVKDPADELAYRCNICYQKARAATKTAEGVNCFDCARTKSSQWYRHQDNRLAYRCDACYRKVRASAKTAVGVSCMDCARTKSSRWYSPQDNRLAYRCSHCYQKARKSDGAGIGRVSLKRKRSPAERSGLNPKPSLRKFSVLDNEWESSINSKEEAFLDEISDEVFLREIAESELFENLEKQVPVDVPARITSSSPSSLNAEREGRLVNTDEELALFIFDHCRYQNSSRGIGSWI